MQGACHRMAVLPTSEHWVASSPAKLGRCRRPTATEGSWATTSLWPMTPPSASRTPPLRGLREGEEKMMLLGLDPAPAALDDLDLVVEQRLPMALEIAREQPAREAGDQPGNGNVHGVDAAAGGPEAQRRADAEDVNVGKPWRFARRLLLEGIVGAEIGIGREQRIFLAGWRRETVVPQGDLVGKGGKLGPQMHVLAGAGAADREVGRKRPARRLDADAIAFHACVGPGAFGVHGEGVGESHDAGIGIGRKAFARLENVG